MNKVKFGIFGFFAFALLHLSVTAGTLRKVPVFFDVKCAEDKIMFLDTVATMQGSLKKVKEIQLPYPMVILGNDPSVPFEINFTGAEGSMKVPMDMVTGSCRFSNGDTTQWQSCTFDFRSSNVWGHFILSQDGGRMYIFAGGQGIDADGIYPTKCTVTKRSGFAVNQKLESIDLKEPSNAQ